MRKGLAVLAVVLLSLAGCQKLNYSNTPEVKLGDVWVADFSPPSYTQNVQASISPETCSVSAYLVTEANAEAVKSGLERGQAPDAKLILAGKTFKPSDSKQDFTLDATIPAKTPYRLIINGGSKTTKVKIKVVGK